MTSGLTPRSAAHLRSQQAAAQQAEYRELVDTKAKHYLYRCWDSAGNLLYIGCTRDVGARMQVHASSWHNPASAYLTMHMTRHEVEPAPYAGRRAGRAAEKAAIQAESPLLNVHHNAGRGLPRVPFSEMESSEVEAIRQTFAEAFRDGAA